MGASGARAKQVPVVGCLPGPISVSCCRTTQQRELSVEEYTAEFSHLIYDTL